MLRKTNIAELNRVEDDRDKCKTRMKLGNELQGESKEDICAKILFLSALISLKHKTKEEYFMIVLTGKRRREMIIKLF